MNLLKQFANNNCEVKFMAVSHKTTIAFSLVSVPVSLYTATQDNDISFNQLHEADGQRIRYKKFVVIVIKKLKMKIL